MAKKTQQETKVEEAVEVEEFEVYEDEDGNEFILVDGEFVPFDADEYEVSETGADDTADTADDEDDTAADDEDDTAADDADEDDEDDEVFEVFEDEDGEYILVDGKRVPFDESEYVVLEEHFELDPDDPSYNPLAYESVQAATDVANDIARAGGSIVRDGAAIAGEMKEAMDDIKTMFDFKSWLK
ncbi:MAG: hypothetical protein IJ113_08100 [Eggerthellaceae bacterium]|nr:hypothetical protein [Eggerthellaceae bacterium]